MVEISEFPQLAVKYNVQGVPLTVINEKEQVTGAVPPISFAQSVLKSIGK